MATHTHTHMKNEKCKTLNSLWAHKGVSDKESRAGRIAGEQENGSHDIRGEKTLTVLSP